MTTIITPGRYPIHCTREWWVAVSDAVRERAVAEALAEALDLPAEIVEIVTDSDEEYDLASVWLIPDDDREEVIGHVTTDPDGMIVVEILDDTV